MTATDSAAVTQVYDVVIAAFPGRPTDGAVDDLQQDVLAQMEETDPRGVILDISEVTTLDSFFARVISETASMVELMGGTAIVVGMQPSVAITAAELGFGLDSVESARSTDHALTMLGVRVEDADGEETEDDDADDADEVMTDPTDNTVDGGPTGTASSPGGGR